MEKTPEETVHEQLKSLENLLLIPGNILLFAKIKAYVDKIDLSDIASRLIPEARIHFDNLKCIYIFDTVFDITLHVHLFSNQPYKVFEYLKAMLFKYEISLGMLLKELILDIMHDESRFQEKSEQINFIAGNLSELDLTTTPASIDVPPGIGAFEYFTGKDSFSELKDFMNSFLSVRGLLLTKYEYYKKLLRENWSPELVFVIGEMMEAHKEQSEPKGIRRFLDPDIFELKPNIAGIGINLNELINKFRKH